MTNVHIRSNEFGGTLLFVDEVFAVPEARNRGIGRSINDSAISRRVLYR